MSAVSISKLGEQFSQAATISSEELPQELLMELEKAGCQLDLKRVVFGPRGESWPVVTHPRKPIVIQRCATGVPGSFGMGGETVKEYLQSVLSALKMEPAMRPAPLAPAILPPVDRAAPARQEEQRHRILQHFSTIFPGKISIVSSEMSLEDFQLLGFFKGDHPRPISNRKAEDYLGSELFCFAGGLMGIVKDGKVLGYSKGLEKAPSVGKGLYQHKNSSRDVPFVGAVVCQTSLNDLRTLEAITPYLNGMENDNR